MVRALAVLPRNVIFVREEARSVHAVEDAAGARLPAGVHVFLVGREPRMLAAIPHAAPHFVPAFDSASRLLAAQRTGQDPVGRAEAYSLGGRNPARAMPQPPDPGTRP